MSIFIDLRKAFDMVQHPILLDKLRMYGFRGLPLNWIKSYLENRKQCVKVGLAKSDFRNVNIGIPHGSILGPILFLIYINDLPNVSNILSSILFADDTTLSISNSSYTELVNVANRELDLICSWL